IGSMHALQGHDLAGHAVHGDADAMHVEADRPRRQICLASRLEAMALFGSGGIKLCERDLPVDADDRIVLQTAFGNFATDMTARIIEVGVAERDWRALCRLAREHRAGAREGARIVRGTIAVSTDHG